MRSPVVALFWQLWLRNRWGLLAMGVVLVLGTTTLRLLPGDVRSIQALKYVVFVSVLMFSYAISMFTYSNFTGRHVHDSLRFPARLFQLPVHTAVLVAVPMVGGILFSALLWVAISALFFAPLGMALPFAMPALGLAAALGYFQVLSWCPIGSPVFRAMTATLLGTGAVLLAVYASMGLQWPRALPWVILGTAALLAYPAALLGVARDRRGGAITGPGFLRSVLDGATSLILRERGKFDTPGKAQLWFELRSKALPFALLTIVLFLWIVATSMIFVRSDPRAARMLFMAACMLPFLSPSVFGPALAKPNLWGSRYELPAFIAIRPLATGPVLASMLRAAFLGQLWIWAVVVVTAILRFRFLGAPDGLVHLWEALNENHGVAGAWVVAAGCVAGFVTLSLGMLAGGLTWGATGRMGLMVGGMMLKSVVAMVLLWSLSSIGSWLSTGLEAQRIAAGVLLGLVLAKLVAAGWALRVSVHRGWIDSTFAWLLLIAWTGGVALLGTLALTCLPSGSIPLPPVGIVCIAGLMLPLIQPALGPAALAWNRHR